MIEKIISGGQTGVDTGALLAARASGVQTGGWCPPDGRNESGPIPKIFDLRPTPVERSDKAPEVPRSLRTEWNIRDSDATLLITGPSQDPGSNWTRRCASEIYRKPLKILLFSQLKSHSAKGILNWISEYDIRILNVAGPPASQWDKGEEVVKSFILHIL